MHPPNKPPFPHLSCPFPYRSPRAPGLTLLFLGYNPIGGTLPPSLQMPDTLQFLLMENVNVSGPLPPWPLPAVQSVGGRGVLGTTPQLRTHSALVCVPRLLQRQRAAEAPPWRSAVALSAVLLRADQPFGQPAGGLTYASNAILSSARLPRLT